MTGFFRYDPNDGVTPEEGEIGPPPEVVAALNQTIEDVGAAIRQRMAVLLRQVYFGTEVTGHLADGRTYTVVLDTIDAEAVTFTFDRFEAQAQAPDGN